MHNTKVTIWRLLLFSFFSLNIVLLQPLSPFEGYCHISINLCLSISERESSEFWKFLLLTRAILSKNDFECFESARAFCVQMTTVEQNPQISVLHDILCSFSQHENMAWQLLSLVFWHLLLSSSDLRLPSSLGRSSLHWPSTVLELLLLKIWWMTLSNGVQHWLPSAAAHGLSKKHFWSFWMTFGESQAKSARDWMFEGKLDKGMEWFDVQQDGIGALLIRIQM